MKEESEKNFLGALEHFFPILLGASADHRHPEHLKITGSSLEDIGVGTRAAHGDGSYYAGFLSPALAGFSFSDGEVPILFRIVSSSRKRSSSGDDEVTLRSSAA